MDPSVQALLDWERARRYRRTVQTSAGARKIIRLPDGSTRTLEIKPTYHVDRVPQEEQDRLFGQFVATQQRQFQKWLAKGRKQEGTDLVRQLRSALDDELNKLPKKATKKELEAATKKLSNRVGDILIEVAKEQLKQAYLAGLYDIGRETGLKFTLGGRHKQTLQAALEGKGMADAFADFSSSVSRRLKEIVQEGFSSGLAGSAVVSQMIDEVGFEARPRLERIARNEAWKVWETARSEAYSDLEERHGETYNYRFGTADDDKTCEACNEIMRRVGDGVPLEKLKTIIVQVSTSKKWGNPNWTPTRDGNFPLPHPGCRHRHWRVVGEEDDDLAKSVPIDCTCHPYIGAGKNCPHHEFIDIGPYNQKEAFTYYGIPIEIELEPGEVRRGKGKEGVPWQRVMVHAYGHFPGTLGTDKEDADCYIGPIPSDRVFIITQVDQDTLEKDELKVMLGFPDQTAAIRGYLAHYPEGWQVGSVEEVSIDDLRDRISSNLLKAWLPHTGIKGGKGWRNSITGETRYQANKPAESLDEATASLNAAKQALHQIEAQLGFAHPNVAPVRRAYYLAQEEYRRQKLRSQLRRP